MASSVHMVLASAGEGGWHGGWWPLWLVFWLAVAAAVAWLVARRRGDRGPSGSDRAREILAERYARGDITTEEYRDRLAQLA